MSDELDPEEVLDSLAGVVYPANRATLVEHARDGGAAAAVLDGLAAIPDADYNGPTAVRRALIDTNG